MTTARAKWANDRLSAWLRQDNEGTALDLLEQIREAVQHWTECTGQDRTCAGTSDGCDESDPEDCASCATPCEDCATYRTGRSSGSAHWPDYLPTLEVVSELEALLETREESVA